MQFLCVYIQEAHPSDGWQMPVNESEGIVYTQPTSQKAREEVAAACQLDLQLEMPLVIDEIDNEVDSAYSALPERLYVIDAGGTIVYRGEPGPWGFDPDGWEAAIQTALEVAGVA